MAKKGKHKHSFFENFRYKYKIYVLNENTLETKFSFKLSFLGLTTIICLILTLFLILTFFIEFKTPIIALLPEYRDAELRENITQNVLTIDSLSNELIESENYLNSIKLALLGEVSADSISFSDSIDQEQLEISFEKAMRERNFCEEYEKEDLLFQENEHFEKHKISFIKPALHITEYITTSNSNIIGTHITIPPNENIMAIGNGTIIYAELQDGYTIHIQHHNNCISIYKHVNSFTKKIGDMVLSGDIIGRNSKNETDFFSLQIWENGQTINPEKSIIF